MSTSTTSPQSEEEEKLILEPQPITNLRERHPSTTIDYTVRHLSGEPHIIITASHPTYKSIIARQESGGFEVHTPNNEVEFEQNKQDALTTAVDSISYQIHS